MSSFNLEPLSFPLLKDTAAEDNMSYCPFTPMEEPNSPVRLSQYLLLNGVSRNEASGVRTTSREMSESWWCDSQLLGTEENHEEPAKGIAAETLEIEGYMF